MSLGSSGEHGLCIWETSRQDLGMSLVSFRLPGGLRMCEHPGRILGYPWDPPDCLKCCACGDIQEGFWDVLGLLQNAWRDSYVCGVIEEGSWDALEILWTA